MITDKTIAQCILADIVVPAPPQLKIRGCRFDINGPALFGEDQSRLIAGVFGTGELIVLFLDEGLVKFDDLPMIERRFDYLYADPAFPANILDKIRTAARGLRVQFEMA